MSPAPIITYPRISASSAICWDPDDLYDEGYMTNVENTYGPDTGGLDSVYGRYQPTKAVPEPSQSRIHVLFIDAYDSFSNNIISVVQSECDAVVTKVHIDDDRFFNRQGHFREFLHRFDAVIAGPGPGDPRRPECLGLMGYLWDLPLSSELPVLGVCLGFQSLAQSLGAGIERLQQPRHGLVAKIAHRDFGIFEGVGDVLGTQYHSLRAVTDHRGGIDEESRWMHSKQQPDLLPLAWDTSCDANGLVLMGCKHRTRPFWGVQFHPESSGCNSNARLIIKQFSDGVRRWNRLSRLGLKRQPDVPQRTLRLPSPPSSDPAAKLRARVLSEVFLSELPKRQSSVAWKKYQAGRPVKVSDIVRALHLEDQECVLLESAVNPQSDHPRYPGKGRFSILGLVDPDSHTPILEWSARDHSARIGIGSHAKETIGKISDIWSTLRHVLKDVEFVAGPEDTPFWGGWMGFVTYEGCLSQLHAGLDTPSTGKNDHPDLCFAFVKRSIVLDHQTGAAYLQAIGSDHDLWITETLPLIALSMDLEPQHCICRPSQGNQETPSKFDEKMPYHLLRNATLARPDPTSYQTKVADCMEKIRGGWSYQLCFTDRTTISLPKDPRSRTKFSGWQLYDRLRTRNPAPFGAFLRLGTQGLGSASAASGVTLLSSSPERFLSWDDRRKRCEFRPMKGTVKKTPNMTIDEAERILRDQKDQAENLMISDLIRHDLHGIVGAGNVHDPEMKVEEYETVFQLVSIITGDYAMVKQSANDDFGEAAEPRDVDGIDLLAASIPPGSMTGAPKRKACELLNQIEGKPRSVYSGILGYMDVAGRGDFSVLIRCAFKWGDESTTDRETWNCGAGGAITALSTPQGEYDEMVAKQSSVLSAFLSWDGDE